MTGRLTAESPSLHTTLKAHTPAIRLCIDELTLLEPICANDGANLRQARLILNAELVQVAAETDLVGSKMPSLRPRHVSGFLDASADLDGPVAVLLASFVGNNLHAIELEDCAGGALCGLGVVEGGHAFLDSEGAGARRQGVRLALEGGRLGGAQHGQIETGIEATGLDFRVERLDGACECARQQ